MALIKDMKGRLLTQAPSGYTRVFGNAQLGNLISKVQGASISAGTELETILWQQVNQIPDLDSFIANTTPFSQSVVWVARRKQISKSVILRHKMPPDFMSFDLNKNECHIIELKDGDQFDTKKSEIEHLALCDFSKAVNLPFIRHIYLCCFNANSNQEIVAGLKSCFKVSETLTGVQLCSLWGINYGSIVNSRRKDQINNLDYFRNELINIPTLRIKKV